MCKMSKIRNFWYLEGNTMPLTCLNHLCLRAHMYFQSIVDPVPAKFDIVPT